MDSERFPLAGDLAGTGDPRVDEVVAGLAGLGDRPLEEHPPVLEAVHDKLREILGELGEPGRPGRPGHQVELAGQDGPGQDGPGEGRPGPGGSR